jgi:copper resistance protein C
LDPLRHPCTDARSSLFFFTDGYEIDNSTNLHRAALFRGQRSFVDHAEPAVGSSVDVPPKEIKIWFTEEPQPALSQIQLFDHRGKLVTQNRAAVDPADPSLLSLPVPAMRPGKYRVTWRVMSVDRDMTVGTFFFAIRKKR